MAIKAAEISDIAHANLGSCLDQRRYYINNTGTGNTLNLSHQRVLQMVTSFAPAEGRGWPTGLRSRQGRS